MSVWEVWISCAYNLHIIGKSQQLKQKVIKNTPDNRYKRFIIMLFKIVILTRT